MDLALIIGADGSDTLYTWVDASYAIHHDMRSHTGGARPLGTGGLLGKSTSESVDSWGRNIFVKKYTEFQYVEHENRAQDMEICASQTEYDVKYPFLCVNFHTI